LADAAATAAAAQALADAAAAEEAANQAAIEAGNTDSLIGGIDDVVASVSGDAPAG